MLWVENSTPTEKKIITKKLTNDSIHKNLEKKSSSTYQLNTGISLTLGSYFIHTFFLIVITVCREDRGLFSRVYHLPLNILHLWGHLSNGASSYSGLWCERAVICLPDRWPFLLYGWPCKEDLSRAGIWGKGSGLRGGGGGVLPYLRREGCIQFGMIWFLGAFGTSDVTSS